MKNIKETKQQFFRKCVEVLFNFGVLSVVVQGLYYVLKHLCFVESEIILGVFFAVYGVIVVLYMIKRRKNFFVRHLVITFLIGIVVYNYVTYPSYTYRYRMTVEVDTPEGVKSGSSVIEVITKQSNSWFTGIATAIRVRGEAVFVELLNGNTLFVMKRSSQDNDHAKYMLSYTFPPKERLNYGVKNRKAIYYYGNLKNESGLLPINKLPLMVYFTDIDKPISIKEVDPNNLEEFFGEGVKLKRIVIETTDDPVEEKIHYKLKWLGMKGSLDGSKIHSSKAKNPMANLLGSGAFSYVDSN